jgi:hypothetical protein
VHPNGSLIHIRQIFFTRLLFEGIEFLAKTERKSKKKRAHELMELGISHFMAGSLFLFGCSISPGSVSTQDGLYYVAAGLE